MSDKNGAVEIQFNWVFIIIAGSVLLMFFVKIAGDYKSSSETKIATEVLDKIGSIASTGQLSSKSSSIIEVKDLQLQSGCEATSCNEYGCSVRFDFQGMGLPAPVWMELEPVFASKYIRGGKLIMWSLDWTAPYKVSNFLYLTSADHKFVFVYDLDNPGSEAFAKNAYNKFTENEYVEAVLVEEDDLGNVRYNGEDMIKFILFFNPSSNLMPSSEIPASKWDVLFLNGNMESGNVWFSKIQSGTKVKGESYQYYGPPMLMGAIFSDSVNDYKCNVRKAMLKYLKMNTIYEKRREMLYNHFSAMAASNPASICENFYGVDLESYIQGLNSSVNSTYDLENAQEIVDNVDLIEEKNQQALQKDCPRIY